MAFSWKAAKKRGIKHTKYRIEIYKNQGRNAEADVLKRKIDRLQKDG